MHTNDLFKTYDFRGDRTGMRSKERLFERSKASMQDEIEKLKPIVNLNRLLLMGLAAIVVVGFLGFVIDAIYFHISNNKYFENIYELWNDQRQDIDNIKAELQILNSEIRMLKIKN